MEKYRKALKNYTTSKPADNTVKGIQSLLLTFGAKAILFEYEDGGLISGIQFKIEINRNDHGVKVPISWHNTAEVLKRQGFYRDDYHAYRVALANVECWLDAQLALLSTEMVEFPQIFLPYMTNHQGRTLYEVAKGKDFLMLEDGVV